MKVVIDTNILLVSISERSPYHLIFKSFLDKKYELCVTTEILNEYAEIILIHASKELSDYALKTIENSPNVQFITRYYAFELIKLDPDDNKFVDCSIAANADFIVTQDGHFKVLKDVGFPKVAVISIEEFMSILNDKVLD